MLGLTTTLRLPLPPVNQFIIIPKTLYSNQKLLPPFNSTRNFLVYAQTNGGGGGGDENKGEEGRPKLNMRWLDLVLDPDPNNVAAVGLTGLLTWASVQVLWQLFLISFAIVVAALKYSFIAALLIFILITLL